MLLFIIVFNFFMLNFSFADQFEEIGSSLFDDDVTMSDIISKKGKGRLLLKPVTKTKKEASKPREKQCDERQIHKTEVFITSVLIKLNKALRHLQRDFSEREYDKKKWTDDNGNLIPLKIFGKEIPENETKRCYSMYLNKINSYFDKVLSEDEQTSKLCSKITNSCNNIEEEIFNLISIPMPKVTSCKPLINSLVVNYNGDITISNEHRTQHDKPVDILVKQDLCKEYFLVSNSIVDCTMLEPEFRCVFNCKEDLKFSCTNDLNQSFKCSCDENRKHWSTAATKRIDYLYFDSTLSNRYDYDSIKILCECEQP